MSKSLKAKYIVELEESTKVPEFAFDDIQRLIEKDLRVKKVTRCLDEEVGL